MDSQIAKDLDGILTVLRNHFGPEQSDHIVRRAPIDPAAQAVVWVLVALLIIGGVWVLWKMANLSIHKSPFEDKQFRDAQLQNMIARERYQQALNQSALDRLSAPPVVSYGEPNSLPLSRPIGETNEIGAGWVYLIQCGDMHKIGIASDPNRRLSNLQTANPSPLKLIHKIKSNQMRTAEIELHQRYKAKRIKREWFALTAEDVAAICAIDEMNYQSDKAGPAV